MKIRFALPLTLIAGFSFFACGTAGQQEEIAGSKDNAGRQEEIAGPKGILDPGDPTFGDVESHATTASGLCDGTGHCGDLTSGCIACAVSGPCEGQLDACLTSTECTDYESCLSACMDSSCVDACAAQEPEGAALYLELVECVLLDECPGDCGGSPGSGGGPGGPPGSCDNTGECGDASAGGVHRVRSLRRVRRAAARLPGFQRVHQLRALHRGVHRRPVRGQLRRAGARRRRPLRGARGVRRLRRLRQRLRGGVQRSLPLAAQSVTAPRPRGARRRLVQAPVIRRGRGARGGREVRRGGAPPVRLL